MAFSILERIDDVVTVLAVITDEAGFRLSVSSNGSTML